MTAKWDERFINLALHIAEWSKDPSSKVGAVIADHQNRIVSLGFNGFPAGTSDALALYEDRSEKYRRVIHAERNAILFAKRDLEGCVLYCTHPPCAPCMAMIIQSGIKRVGAILPGQEFIERWKEDMESAERMAIEAGIELIGFKKLEDGDG